MEVAPLLLATFSLILSLALAGMTLKGQTNHFRLISWQETRFDCEDTASIVTGQSEQMTTPFDDLSLDCLIPHLHEPGRSKDSPLAELFRVLTQFCAAGGCE
jgi:hypothetical protein